MSTYNDWWRTLRALKAYLILRPKFGWSGSAVMATLCAAMIVSGYAFVLGQNGARSIWIEMAYLPVFVAGISFKMVGVAIVGTICAIVFGPLMPFDVAANLAQSADSWLARSVIFTIVGSAAALMSGWIDYYRDKARQRRHSDPVTGLPEHVRLTDQFLRRVGANRSVASVCVGFDGLHDRLELLGVRKSDAVLRRIGKLIKAELPDAVGVTRVHNEIFGLLIDGNEQDARKVVRRLQRRLPQFVRVGAISMSLFPKAGIAMLPPSAEPDRDVFNGAMLALAKCRGRREGLAVFTDADKEAAERRLEMQGDVIGDFEQGCLDVHYQPKIEIETGFVSGTEALLRWHSKKYKSVSPGQFIPLLEETPTISQVTRFVIGRSAMQIKAWQRMNRDIAIAVNLSARDIADDDLIRFTELTIDGAGIDPRKLQFEITERAALENFDEACRFIGALRERGHMVSLDDFGTGHSSLRWLTTLPVEEIKIDKSFIETLTASGSTHRVVETIVSLAKELGMKTCAEGVEDQETLEAVRALGIDSFQGFLVAGALPADKLDRLLKRHGVPVTKSRNQRAQNALGKAGNVGKPALATA